MTLAGTRPPLISETNLYELHHRARLAIKPGITGMWQVSGRSDITDFEEVVRLDKEYITNWNIGLDMKILLNKLELSDTELEEDVVSIPADPDVKNFSFTVVNEEVYYRENSVMNRMELPAMTAERVKGMVKIRDVTNELIRCQMEEGSDEQITKLQEKLNEEYDTFTAKYGLISSNANKRAFSQDSSYITFVFLHEMGHWIQFNSLNKNVFDFIQKDLVLEKNNFDKMENLKKQRKERIDRGNKCKLTAREKKLFWQYMKEYRAIPKEKEADEFALSKMEEALQLIQKV